MRWRAFSSLAAFHSLSSLSFLSLACTFPLCLARHARLRDILNLFDHGAAHGAMELSFLATGSRWTAAARVHPDRAALSSCVEALGRRTENCVEIERMMPNVHEALMAPGFEKGWSEKKKEDAEVRIGKRVQRVREVQEFAGEVLGKTVQVLVKGTEMIERRMANRTEVMMKAFGWNGRSVEEAKRFTGYVEEMDVMAVEREGNLREKWTLLYLMNRNRFFDDLLHRLANLSDVELASLPIDKNVLRDRKRLISKTVKPHDGVANFLYPVTQSWARFSFDYPQWSGCRRERRDCRPMNKTTSDPSFSPPLSSREVKLQCLNTENEVLLNSPPITFKENCSVQWCTGENKFYIVKSNFGEAAGFLERMQRTGFRAIAGPSATTSNMLQLATILGLGTQEKLSLVVLSMLAWMLPAHDHSLMEIFLAASPYFESERSEQVA